MARIGRKPLRVRGKVLRDNPRVPSPLAPRNLHPQRPVPETLATLKTNVKPRTLFERLAFNEDGSERPSKFGGTDLERAADNGAAEELHFEFDYAQMVLPLTINGSYTVVDRVLKPRTLVYLDGIMHFLRLDAEQQDLIQEIELKTMGYLVVRISYIEMMADPINALRRCLYAY